MRLYPALCMPAFSWYLIKCEIENGVAAGSTRPKGPSSPSCWLSLVFFHSFLRSRQHWHTLSLHHSWGHHVHLCSNLNLRFASHWWEKSQRNTWLMINNKKRCRPMAAGTSQTDKEVHPRKTRSARSWQSNGLSGKNSEKKVTSNLQNKTGSALIEAPGSDPLWLRVFLISPICPSSSPPACEPEINLSTPCWRTRGRVLLSVFYLQYVKAESMDCLTSSSSVHVADGRGWAG